MSFETAKKIAQSYGLIFENTTENLNYENKNIFIVPCSDRNLVLFSDNVPYSHQVRFRLLTNQKPRLLVRIDEKNYYLSALNFFNPGGILARFYLIVMKLASFVNVMPSFGTTDFLAFYGKYCLKNIQLQYLNLLPTEIIAIYIGTADPCRKLVIYADSAQFGEIIIKVSTDKSSSIAIKREIGAMKTVEILDLKEYLPEIIEYKEFTSGLNVIISRAVHGDRQFAKKKEELAFRFLKNLYTKKQDTTSVQEWLDTYIQPDIRNLVIYPSVLEAITQVLSSIQVRCSHGDFSIWNMFIKDGKIKIIDWEEFGEDIILADLFQYHYSKWLCSQLKTISSRYYLKKIYRHATTISDGKLSYFEFIVYFYLWLSTRVVDPRYFRQLHRVLAAKILQGPNWE